MESANAIRQPLKFSILLLRTNLNNFAFLNVLQTQLCQIINIVNANKDSNYKSLLLKDPTENHQCLALAKEEVNCKLKDQLNNSAVQEIKLS